MSRVSHLDEKSLLKCIQDLGYECSVELLSWLDDEISSCMEHLLSNSKCRRRLIQLGSQLSLKSWPSASIHESSILMPSQQLTAEKYDRHIQDGIRILPRLIVKSCIKLSDEAIRRIRQGTIQHVRTLELLIKFDSTFNNDLRTVSWKTRKCEMKRRFKHLFGKEKHAENSRKHLKCTSYNNEEPSHEDSACLEKILYHSRVHNSQTSTIDFSIDADATTSAMPRKKQSRSKAEYQGESLRDGRRRVTRALTLHFSPNDVDELAAEIQRQHTFQPSTIITRGIFSEQKSFLECKASASDVNKDMKQQETKPSPLLIGYPVTRASKMRRPPTKTDPKTSSNVNGTPEDPKSSITSTPLKTRRRRTRRQSSSSSSHS